MALRLEPRGGRLPQVLRHLPPQGSGLEIALDGGAKAKMEIKILQEEMYVFCNYFFYNLRLIWLSENSGREGIPHLRRMLTMGSWNAKHRTISENRSKKKDSVCGTFPPCWKAELLWFFSFLRRETRSALCNNVQTHIPNQRYSAFFEDGNARNVKLLIKWQLFFWPSDYSRRNIFFRESAIAPLSDHFLLSFQVNNISLFEGLAPRLLQLF